MDDPKARDRLGELRTVLAHIGMPAVLFVVASNVVIGSEPVARWIDQHRPTRPNITVNVELQMLHLETRRWRASTAPLVAITGSSSVVNGIDTAIVDSLWAAVGLSTRSVNAGLTMLTAYELPLLKRDLLAPGTTEVVYLYNGFSFSDRYHADAVGTRFDAAEFLRIFGWRVLFREIFSKGVLGEHLFVVRFRNLLHVMATRIVRGEVARRDFDYDHPPGDVVEGPLRGRPCEPAVSDSNFARVRLRESAAGKPTAGYRALERFFALARERGVRVIVGPIPVPDFAACNGWRRGIPQAPVDSHVARIAANWGVRFLPWDSVATIAADDRLFRDQVHMSDSGRARYSTLLARQLAGGLVR